MPPKFKYSKEEIVKAAYNLVDEKGIESLTARALGEKLSSSSKIIFGSFSNMNEVKIKITELGYYNFGVIMEECVKNNKLSYIDCGLAYVKFAKEHPNIFKLLFMSDRINNDDPEYNTTNEFIAHIISTKSGISLEDANIVRDKYWFFMHGMATSVITSYVKYDEEISKIYLKEVYEALIKSVKDKGDKK